MPHGVSYAAFFLPIFRKTPFIDTMYQNKVLPLFFLMDYTSCSINIYLP